MAELRHSFSALLCATLFAAVALPAHAAKWYRVELLIFEQPRGSSSEQWTAVPELEYPERFRFLIDPQTLSAAQESGLSFDRYGRRVRGDSTTLAGEAIPTADSDPAQQATDTAADQDADPGSTLTATVPDATASANQPLAYVLSDRDELEFRGKAAYMERNGGYRVLFHESWLQPIGQRRHSRALVLDRSGDGGPWPQLQGSIRLHLARYLHLQTNLWLNTPGDYLPGTWRMPPPPRGPASVLDATAPELTAAPEFGMDDTSQIASDPNAPGHSAGSDYPYRHAIVMRQTRKMRSSEVHYIDHPKLGLVIKLTPVTWEEEESAVDESPVEGDPQ
ncbi:MAG: hypothetical protein Hals2KO_02940 [Halioglobus sp.]